MKLNKLKKITIFLVIIAFLLQIFVDILAYGRTAAISQVGGAGVAIIAFILSIPFLIGYLLTVIYTIKDRRWSYLLAFIITASQFYSLFLIDDLINKITVVAAITLIFRVILVILSLYIYFNFNKSA